MSKNKSRGKYASPWMSAPHKRPPPKIDRRPAAQPVEAPTTTAVHVNGPHEDPPGAVIVFDSIPRNVTASEVLRQRQEWERHVEEQYRRSYEEIRRMVRNMPMPQVILSSGHNRPAAAQNLGLSIDLESSRSLRFRRPDPYMFVGVDPASRMAEQSSVTIQLSRPVLRDEELHLSWNPPAGGVPARETIVMGGRRAGQASMNRLLETDYSSLEARVVAAMAEHVDREFLAGLNHQGTVTGRISSRDASSVASTGPSDAPSAGELTSLMQQMAQVMMGVGVSTQEAARGMQALSAAFGVADDYLKKAHPEAGKVIPSTRKILRTLAGAVIQTVRAPNGGVRIQAESELKSISNGRGPRIKRSTT